MNPYEVLGLTPQASSDEAKKAFRRLAQLHHPDKGGSESKFKEIKAAWEQIQAGWRPVYRAPEPQAPHAPARSSFTTPKRPQPVYPTGSSGPKFKLPRAEATGLGRNRQYSIAVEVPRSKAALYGAYVQFMCDDDTVTYHVRPGTTESYGTRTSLPVEGLVGNSVMPRTVTVTIKVNITGD